MTPLKNIRIEQGMTLSDVVDLLATRGESIDTGNLSRIERGIQRPSPKLAESLVSVFGGAINEMHVIYPERFLNTPDPG
ncbi:MAG TPA: XRE family transcriptional regulator [Pseudomonas sp.]|nr:XRE family transcriptional regulator [Pseudomonas sp.]